MTLTLSNFEVFILILVRISGFMVTAPFFSLRFVPMKVKTGLAIFMTLILLYTTDYTQPAYVGILGFTSVVVTEAIAGVVMGFFANIAYYILNFAGQLLDMQIGFSMASQLDPVTNVETTITTNLYSYLVIIMMMITNLHLYFVSAIIDSFKVIPLGKVVLDTNIYQLMLQFVTEYFVIGFRIVLPIFAAILVVDAVLGIMAKAAPQMNMFVIGMQVRILVGLIVLIVIMGLVPSVADLIFREMITMLKSSIALLY